MFYVWVIVNGDGTPMIDAIESDQASAVAKFLRTRPPGPDSRLDWHGWEARGYRCERFKLSRENGRER